MSKLWGMREVADFLGVPVNTLYQWRTRNYGPPGKRIGKYVRFIPDEVRAWVDAQPSGVA
ncbi:helix-turn-helix domain-containing protein [Saccharothrix longispora]|uniref:helix-turn-helix transcriptional regulator n=1 Tax=Saccharothrix longispora TaxID=33920 RepID=UPI0028FD215C|nr:helix-turn-helix domain-containing protein [Saccharothrix longispora]MDU0290735.1 helix-turn-helix domain-containing protein [Saccharothrix longispora]